MAALKQAAVTASRVDQHQPASSDSLLAPTKCKQKSVGSKREMSDTGLGCKLADQSASCSSRQPRVSAQNEGQQNRSAKPVYSISRMTQMARVSRL